MHVKSSGMANCLRNYFFIGKMFYKSCRFPTNMSNNCTYLSANVKTLKVNFKILNRDSYFLFNIFINPIFLSFNKSIIFQYFYRLMFDFFYHYFYSTINS